MANPYPAIVIDANGQTREGVAVSFTDPDNQPGGSPQAGVSIVRKFPFAFNAAGILTGHALYTPTVGDILLAGWLEIVTAWDGTTPLGDIGIFSGGFAATGYFGNLTGQPLHMDEADGAGSPLPTLGGNNLSDFAFASQLASTSADEGNGLLAVSGADVNLAASAIRNGGRQVPAKFAAATPIKFVVSQDGTNGGASPGSTMGAAILYLVTATPT